MNNYRKQIAYNKRETAASLARNRPHPRHQANGDELKYRFHDGNTDSCYLASYTKGLPHSYKTGLIEDSGHFQKFVRGIDSGDPRDFRDTPLAHAENRLGWSFKEVCDQYDFSWKSHKAKKLPAGPNKGKAAQVRAWESAGAGNTYDLEGPDAQALTMPPAPVLGSDELIAEMGEVYVQALLRDVSFDSLTPGASAKESDQKLTDSLTTKLNALDWYNKDCCHLSDAERHRHRKNLTAHTVFRGQTRGDLTGPYISQFLLAGNGSINGVDAEPGRSAASGWISYGAQIIDQRVRKARPCVDYMTDWAEWFDVQQGADLRNLEQYDDKVIRRFITTPRDLATYVHYDALYQAYLNACIIMLGAGVAFDPGIPYQLPDNDDHQQGFAHFGGPHILSMVTEVATRALKAVRFQKFNVHRRARPEVLAARIEKKDLLAKIAPELSHMYEALNDAELLEHVEKHNHDNNKRKKIESASRYLLPMAFCEGSPMHPAYGAGHATVAGACVTILKAFFDHGQPLALADPKDAGKAFIPTADGQSLRTVDVMTSDKHDPNKTVKATLTVEGELNKLASNISIGRNWAGVHYYTDYIESLRMGEQLAIGILEEQKLMYGENFSMTVPLYDGGSIRI